VLVLLERPVAAEGLGPDVLDHRRVAHEAGESLEVRVVPALEAEALGFERIEDTRVPFPRSHEKCIGRFPARL